MDENGPLREPFLYQQGTSVILSVPGTPDINTIGDSTLKSRDGLPEGLTLP